MLKYAQRCPRMRNDASAYERIRSDTNVYEKYQLQLQLQLQLQQQLQRQPIVKGISTDRNETGTDRRRWGRTCRPAFFQRQKAKPAPKGRPFNGKP